MCGKAIAAQAATLLDRLAARSLLCSSTASAQSLHRAAAGAAGATAATVGTAATARATETTAPACYLGIDPTAKSLHLGNLVGLRALALASDCGFRPIVLLGGATGAVGDPSGRSSERKMMDDAELASNAAQIEATVRALVPGVEVVDNGEWYGRMSSIEFVRDVGRHFRVGTMLGKQMCRTRMESGAGLSYTEFSYQLFQAYDWLHLFRERGAAVQLGGSDQWGNLTAGLELIRRVEVVGGDGGGDGGGEGEGEGEGQGEGKGGDSGKGEQVEEEGEEDFGFSCGAVGVTINLLTDSKGEKIGKSTLGGGGGAWLSVGPGLTSPYEMYQFLFNTVGLRWL